jgi:hypothetical protein
VIEDDLDDDPFDYGPLRIVRSALPWTAFISDLTTVSIVYPHSGGGGILSDVIVCDGPDTVAVTLFRRWIAGTYPDGSSNIEPLDLQYSCVAVALSKAVEGRKVIDGSTGKAAAPFPADDELWRSLTERDGCALWVP